MSPFIGGREHPLLGWRNFPTVSVLRSGASPWLGEALARTPRV